MDSLCQAGDMTHLRLTADAFKVLALTSCNLSQCCKELVGLDLEGPFKRPASTANPVTSQLFGDDLPKLVKDIMDTQLVSSKLSRKDTWGRYKGRSWHRTKRVELQKGHRPFLMGRAASHSGRRKGQGRRGPRHQPHNRSSGHQSKAPSQ